MPSRPEKWFGFLAVENPKPCQRKRVRLQMGAWKCLFASSNPSARKPSQSRVKSRARRATPCKAPSRLAIKILIVAQDDRLRVWPGQSNHGRNVQHTTQTDAARSAIRATAMHKLPFVQKTGAQMEYSINVLLKMDILVSQRMDAPDTAPSGGAKRMFYSDHPCHSKDEDFGYFPRVSIRPKT